MRELHTFKHYFWDFYNSLTGEDQEKIDYALLLLKTQNRISTKFVKHLEEGIYELRAESKNNNYRVLFIFDEGNIVLLLNGLQKKTRKTPRRAIKLAIRLRKEYYESKQ